VAKQHLFKDSKIQRLASLSSLRSVQGFKKKYSCIRGLKRFKDSKIQGFNFSEAGIGFKKKSIRAFVAKRIQRFKRFKRFKNSKIQKFNSVKTGIGFKKYSVGFSVSVFWWRQNIRAFVA